MISEFPVFRNPGQLLRFLGLSGPDAPNRVADFVQTSVDLLPWWLLASEQFVEESLAVAAGVTGLVSSAATLKVPAGQRWIVTGLSLRSAPLAAATTIKCTGGYLRNVTRVQVLGLQQSFVAAEAVGVDSFIGNGRDSFVFLEPGDALGVFVAGYTGAAATNVLVGVTYCSFQA